jgi:hypothetical protein
LACTTGKLAKKTQMYIPVKYNTVFMGSLVGTVKKTCVESRKHRFKEHPFQVSLDHISEACDVPQL